MQVKFANRESSNQTGQIKSISKYEMLYIPKSISANKRIYLKSRIIESKANHIVNVSYFNGSGLCYANNGQPVNNQNQRIRLDSAQLIKQNSEHIIQRVSRILVTFVVCLWWISSIGFVHGGHSVSNSIIHTNESITTSQPIEWPWSTAPSNSLMNHTGASTPNRTSIRSHNTHAMRTSGVHLGERMRQSVSSMHALNAWNSDEQNIDDHVDDGNGTSEGHQQQPQQRQQFGISIITRSKKTNPNASFSLDLFKHTGNVQRHNTTLNSLAHESNRIPDAIRESLHHHHSVIKRFRALVTKRYHFLAHEIKDNSSISIPPIHRATQAANIATVTSNVRPIEPPLKHLIYVLTKIDQPSSSVERNQRIHEIAHKQTPRQSINANVAKNSRKIFNVINRTKVLWRDFHHKHFNRSGLIGHTNHKRTFKRSIDLQAQSSQPTTQTPFDDHFFHSKLQNYYFLYQIDNISNYNNHFDLLNSPINNDATQIQINQQRIQFSNGQIDNALIDATKSDFLQYNPYKLNFYDKPSNHIKRILLAKIASMCLNCADGTDPPVKIYVLSRFIPLTEIAANLNHPISTAAVDRKGNSTQELQRPIFTASDKHLSNRKKRFPYDFSSLTNSLRNYPKIADLLSNLSLSEISDQATIQFNYRNENGQSSGTLANKLQVIIDQLADGSKNRSSHETASATLLQLIDANATLNAAHSVHAFPKSLKISNFTRNHVSASAAIAATMPMQRNATTPTISNSNSSPISTFEHYIRIISSRNLNNRNNYAIQTKTTTTTTTTKTDGNKMKSFNFQQKHLLQKFQRVKKQQQIIKLFTTNHRFIHNDMNDNNINGNGNAASQFNDTNIVKNYKLNFTLNENNCTMDGLNANESNAMRGKCKAEKSKRAGPRAHADRKMDRNIKEKTVLTSSKEQTNVENVTESIQITKSKKVKRNERVVTAQHQQSINENSRKSNALNSYLMRLESIKYQILMKLGLKQKPNITNTLPKHVIMETLYRAEDSPQSNGNSRKHPHRKQHRTKQRHKQNKHHSKHNKPNKQKPSPTVLLNDDPNQQVYQFQGHRFSDNIDKDDINNNNNSAEDTFPFHTDLFEESNDVESDDFYGRTREIIIFAEKGSYFNQQPLIEFVSTNGLDESITSDSVKSDAVVIPFNQTVQVNDAKLKQRPKCKGDIIENRQVRKRKRRRRQVFETMDVQKIEARSKPVFLGSNQVQEETMKKSSSSLSSSSPVKNYQSTEFENYSDTRVRRAFLWIKVDETIETKKNTRLPKKATKNPKLKHKLNGNRHRRTFRNFFRLWVFRIVEPSSESNQQIKLSASKSVHVSRLGWQKLDVTSTVRQWYASGGKTRLRFLVDCSGCVGRFKIHLFDSKPTKGSNTRIKPNLLQNDKFNAGTDPVRPFLVIYTDPNVIKRVRRHTPDCSVAVRGQCCKQKFYVSFAELGWEDWIIAPHGYYANYCQGNCNGLRTPDNFRSYHSHVIEEYRKMNRLTGLQPCCTPLKFSSMSLIYYEENQKIIKRDLPKMVVDECGCP